MLSTSFVSATEKYSDYKEYIPAPLMRKSFILEAEAENAKITICALGFYRLFVNGTEITRGMLSPYITNPDDALFYDEYEITCLLKKGKNALGIILGNGMQNSLGGDTWDFDKAAWRSAPMTAFSLEYSYASSLKQNEIISDSSVLTHPSAILLDDLRIGEYYDARLEINGWSEADFDDSGWSSAIPVRAPRGIKNRRMNDVPPVIISKEITPVSVSEGAADTGYGETERAKTLYFPRCEREAKGYLYDFGVNTAGSVKLKINGARDQKIVLLFGETLEADGKLNLKSISFIPYAQQQRIEYTLKGGGEEIYVPSFTYFGFRYCLVCGITAEQATDELVTMLIMHTDLIRTGDFRCSDNAADRLYEMTINSDLSNFYHFPTDCPQREKNGWTGDAALSAEQIMMSFDAAKSYEQWLVLIRGAMDTRGAIPGIVPTAGWGFDWGNGPAWDSVLTYLPYYVWKYTGDIKIIRDNAHAILRYLDYVYSRRDENNLIEIGLGDWCQAGHENSAISAPLVFTDTVTVISIAQKARDMFDCIGMKLQRDFAANIASELRTAVRDCLIDFGTFTAVGNCQTTQAMAIFHDIFEQAEKPFAVKTLIAQIESKNGHFDVGILGARAIFRVLGDFGYADLAYEMIMHPDYPSYGNWIRRGATSLWEDFRSEGVIPNSRNHHFFGDISAWFISYPGGIRVNPRLASADEVDIKPCFIEKLSHVYARHDIPCGNVSVEWTRTDEGVIELKISAPDGAKGFITLPAGYKFDNSAAFCRLKTGEFRVIKAEQKDRNTD